MVGSKSSSFSLAGMSSPGSRLCASRVSELQGVTLLMTTQSQPIAFTHRTDLDAERRWKSLMEESCMGGEEDQQVRCAH